jgi:hypothetical protein
MRQMPSLGCAVLATAMSTSVAAQTATPATPAPPPVVNVAPAPAFKAGDPVTDAAGSVVGPIATLTESDRGAIVVISIDSKLVGVPQSTLKLVGDKVVSSQTKAQMLAAAGAPR